MLERETVFGGRQTGVALEAGGRNGSDRRSRPRRRCRRALAPDTASSRRANSMPHVPDVAGERDLVDAAERAREVHRVDADTPRPRRPAAAAPAKCASTSARACCEPRRAPAARCASRRRRDASASTPSVMLSITRRETSSRSRNSPCSRCARCRTKPPRNAADCASTGACSRARASHPSSTSTIRQVGAGRATRCRRAARRARRNSSVDGPCGLRLVAANLGDAACQHQHEAGVRMDVPMDALPGRVPAPQRAQAADRAPAQDLAVREVPGRLGYEHDIHARGERVPCYCGVRVSGGWRISYSFGGSAPSRCFTK